MRSISCADRACIIVYAGGSVKVGSVGSVTDRSRSHPSFSAQVVADQLGVRPEDVEVVTGDTRRFRYAVGTFASRAAVMSGSAMHVAAGKVRAKALRIYAPKYGHLQLVVTRNRHGNFEYLVSNDLHSDLTSMVVRKRSRWSVETVFRDSKQFAELEACQCWVDQAMVRHVALVLLTSRAVAPRLAETFTISRSSEDEPCTGRTLPTSTRTS